MVTPPIHKTEAEVFILESLRFEDEIEQKLDGKILAQTLRLMGKKPVYHYFRTKDELEMLALIFRESGYRYLHFSCHGSPEKVELTMESITYLEFAEIFSGQLRNRRLTLSACELGNELFSEVVAGKNVGMYSIAAPNEQITFEKSASFWSAFYVRLFSHDKNSMRGGEIKAAITKISDLLGVKFHLSRYVAGANKWKHELIEGALDQRKDTEIKNTIRIARHFLAQRDFDTGAKVADLAMSQAKNSPYLRSRAQAVLAYNKIGLGHYLDATDMLCNVVQYRGIERAKSWHLAPLAFAYMSLGATAQATQILQQLKLLEKNGADLSTAFSLYPGLKQAYSAIS